MESVTSSMLEQFENNGRQKEEGLVNRSPLLMSRNPQREIATGTLIIIALACLSLCTSTSAQTIDRKLLAENVRSEFLHAWTGYKKYCWGHDDLKPLSRTCRDWYGTPILMTPVDSLDSLYLLGFKDEADKTREYIAKNLSFD